MSVNNNRLLLEIDKEIRDINREVINPVIPLLTSSDLKPVMTMVARSRVCYLKELFDLSSVVGEDGIPSPDQVNQLRQLRVTYEEIVNGAQALETAIQRGYVDVENNADS